MLPLILHNKNRLSSQVISYQSVVDYVHAGGHVVASFAADGNFNSGGGAEGITCIDLAISKRIRQDGFIYQAKVGILSAEAGGQIKFKIFRLNGATYDMVAETEVLAVTSSGTKTFTFATPLPCLIGDYVGVWLNGTSAGNPAINTTTVAGGVVGYVFLGDVITTDDFSDQTGPACLNIEYFTYRPFLCGTGDSIMAGWTNRQSWYDAFSGPVSGDPLYQMQQLMPYLRYQNHAMGDQIWNWVRTTGSFSALAVKPKYLLVHAGVNDIDHDVAWAAVDASMDAVLNACNAAGTTLLVAEILPCSNLSDVKSANIRTFNTNYAAWCSANNVQLISMHDAFGQIRGSTGELDDLAAAYNEDGVHLTAAGKLKQAELYKGVL